MHTSFPNASYGRESPDRVSVIVCTYNRADMLANALRSLAEQNTRGEISFEIVVVDDGSTDSTQCVVTAQRDATSVSIRYVRQDHRGVAAARNQGVRETSGEWIAFFDDDQVAASTWLPELVAAATRQGADIVGGPCLLRLPEDCEKRPGPTIRRLLGDNARAMHKEGVSGLGWDPRKCETIPGTGNVLVSRAVFDRVGLFDESRRRGEDREFFLRAKKAGATIAVAPRALMYHIVPPVRLTATYLLRIAAEGGRTQAEIDAAHKVIWRAFLRLCFLLLVAAPRLGWAVLVGDREGILARKCSVIYSFNYVAVSLIRGLHSLRTALHSANHGASVAAAPQTKPCTNGYTSLFR